MDWLALGAELKRLRQGRGLSIRRAADLLGVNFTRVREWEQAVDAHTGRATRPTYDNLRRLARVYGVPANPLLRLAGYGPELALAEIEQRLLEAFRVLPPAEQVEVVEDLVARAAGHDTSLAE